MRTQNVVLFLEVEKQIFRDEMVERCAKTVDVRSEIQFVRGQNLFRAHIRRRSEDFLFCRDRLARFVEDFAKSEVCQFDFACGIDHDIVGFDVAVDDFHRLPPVFKRFRHGLGDYQGVRFLENVLLFDKVVECIAVDVFHDEIVASVVGAIGFESFDYVWMRELRHDTRFLHELAYVLA
jgi:hypothetical protein